MRIATVRVDDRTQVGVVDGDDIVLGDGGGWPDTINDLIKAGRPGLQALSKLVADDKSRRKLQTVEVMAPIPNPERNILCVGKNYREHAVEFHGSGFDAGSAGTIPEAPVIFTKATTSVIGPGESIRSDFDPTGTIDYEGELAVIIGIGGRSIRAESALDHVFGYTVVNDVTSRELQRHHGQWFLGKGIDTFCPMGPWIVTADEIPDPRELHLTVTVNGEVRQNASVSQLLFDIPTLIETISRTTTLVPGDIIATGTPAGVGIGMSPPKYLVDGDVVVVDISRVGTLSSPVNGGAKRASRL